MLNTYLSSPKIIINRQPASWIEASMNLYKGQMIFYVIIKAAEKKNNFALYNGSEVYEKCDGKILRKVWKSLSGYSNKCSLKDCDIRPDEFHGIILIDESANVERLLAKVLTEFKSRSASLLNNYRCTFGKPVWENVFRLDTVRNYSELFNILTTTWR